MIVVNKWDAVEKDSHTMPAMEKDIRAKLYFLDWAEMIFTGIFLVMHYKPDASLNAAGIPIAFASVEYIMREVPFGWLIRYMHSTGASAFFVVIYLHMFRGLIYGSYREPRELVWIFGCLIFLSLMAEAFFAISKFNFGVIGDLEIGRAHV